MTDTPETDEMTKINGRSCSCAEKPIELCLKLERDRNRWRSVAEQAEKALESSRILIDGHIEDSANPAAGIKWLLKAKRLITSSLAVFDSLRKEGQDG